MHLQELENVETMGAFQMVRGSLRDREKAVLSYFAAMKTLTCWVTSS